MLSLVGRAIVAHSAIFDKTDRATRCNFRRNLYRVAVSRKKVSPCNIGGLLERWRITVPLPCDEQNNSQFYDTSSVDFAMVLQNGCHNVDFRSSILATLFRFSQSNTPSRCDMHDRNFLYKSQAAHPRCV